MIRTLFILSVMLWSTLLTAQKSQTIHFIDSMEQLLGRLPEDTLKANTLANLALNYRQTDLKRSEAYALQTISLSKKIQFIPGIKKGYNNLGVTRYNLSQFDSAIAAFKQYAHYCLASNDSINLAWGYNNIGNVYIELGQYNTTLLYYDSALHIRQLKQDTTAIANSYINYGYLYKDLGKYTEALYYLYQALRTMEAARNKEGIAYALNFIGTVYTRKKEYKKSTHYLLKAASLYKELQQFDGWAQCLLSIAINYRSIQDNERSKAYLLQALQLFTDIKDSRQMAIVYSHLGNVYKENGKPTEAYNAFNKAAEINNSIGSSRMLPDNYAGMAEVLLMLHRYTEALQNASKAVQLANQNGSLEQRRRAYQVLAESYEKTGTPARALEAYKVYNQINDSFTNAESQKAATEIQTKYETEKKELELTAKNLELENAAYLINRKRTQLVILICSFVASLLILLLLYNRHRMKQRALHDAEILKQQELRNKAIIEAEEKERIRIAKDLHDGIGQQLSALKMNLSALENNISLDANQKHKMDLLLNLADEAAKEVRSVSHQMMPNALIRSGLTTAVREFVNKLSATDAIKIDLEIIRLNERLDATAETILYRILQESVSNIIKHAKASHISIQLVKHPQHLNMMIEDNGIGFNAEATLNSAGGIGLKNMLSRVQFLNGSIDFDSTPGRGTTVNISIPLT